MAKAPKWREAVILLVSERFGGENCELPEERLGEGFPFLVWKLQVLLDFGFHVVKFLGGSELSEPLEKHFVGSFSFHHFEAIEDLAMRGAFPDGENHGFAKPAFRAVLGEDAEPAVDFHGPLCGVDGKFGGPVFREMGYQTEQMVAIGVGRALHPDFVQELNGFPRQSERRAKRIQAIYKLMMEQRMIEN